MRFFFLTLLFVAPMVSFAYEPTQTHAGLTEQVVEFYNLNSTKKISSEQKELMIKGAIEEDAPALRAVNHFYDPVRNIGIEGGRTAKGWALDDLEANDFSWSDAISAYARGDMDTAFIALGHIVHLVEDMGVPDHTRNDQHLPFLDEDMGGHSPFEDWAAENKNRSTMDGLAQSFADVGATSRSFSQLGEYFDFLASYSNKNFFSRDTIFRQDVYAKPIIETADRFYGYAKDDITGKSEKLVKRMEYKDRVEIILSDKDDTSILSSYFDRLSRQIIPSGAGVVELFFREGEQARLAYEAELRKKQEAEARANAELAQSLLQKGFFGSVWSGMVFLVQDTIVKPVRAYVLRPVGSAIASAVRWSGQESSVAADVASFATAAMSDVIKNTAVTAGEWTTQRASQAITIVQRTVNGILNTHIDPRGQSAGLVYVIDSTPPPSSTASPTPSLSAATKVTPNPSAPRLVFLGSLSPGFGGGAPIVAAPEPPQSPDAADETDEIPQEDTEDTHEDVPEIPPEVPAVPEPPPQPSLTVPQCAFSLATDGCLLATTAIRFEWSEVVGAEYYAVSKNGAYATTTGIALDIIAPDFSDYTFEVAAVGASGQTSATSTKTVSVATIPIAINEVAWMGTVASTSAEWIEIKNNTRYTIDLSQWALASSDGKPFIVLTGTIAAKEYRVLERWLDATVADVNAGQVYGNGGDKWALGNSGEQLNLSYASTTLDQTPEIEDKKWAGGFNSTTTRKTMERYSSKELGTDSANWGTNLGYIKNGIDAKGKAIEGTPGAQNSVSTLINKGRDITSDFTLTSDEERYVITRDGVNVQASTTLTVEPGVTISFFGNRRSGSGYLFVEGAIDARGTPENLITLNSFSGELAGYFWIKNGTATSTFENARFENIGNPVDVMGGVLEIRNSEFVNTDGGVRAYGENSTVLIEDTHFTGLTRDALNAFDGSTIRIASSTITNQLEDDAIAVFSGSTLVVASTTIDGVFDGDGIGAYDSTLTVTNSTIKNVLYDGIGLYDATSTISNVVIANGGRDGIAVDGGSATIDDATVSGFVGSRFTDGTGIVISEPITPVVITGGEITGNDVGISMDEGSAILDLDNVSVHDNAQNIVVFPADTLE